MKGILNLNEISFLFSSFNHFFQKHRPGLSFFNCKMRVLNQLASRDLPAQGLFSLM